MKNRNNITATILLALVFFVLLQRTQAVSPPPDGGYPGQNTAEGQSALLHLAGGTYNTALGWSSLGFNVTGNLNTAVGAGTLLVNTGSTNTATGAGALLSNTTGGGNTADGVFALFGNTTGGGNIAVGNSALESNTNGHNNIAVGADALDSNINGNDNTAIGAAALDLSTGAGNIAVGFNAGGALTTGDNNIYLGSNGVATESNTIRIGISGTQNRAFIRGIRGVTTGNSDAIPVLIDSAGQLGTTSSSRRFKKEIRPMDSASEAILSLKPVTFHYKSDSKDTPQFGLIAEEVAAVNPDLVVHDENGEIYTVRYDAVNAMLLNEFLKEHKKVEEQQGQITEVNLRVARQEAIIARQGEAMDLLAAQLKKQAAQIQRVSGQIELSGTVQTVASDQ
jgi:uncharacterized coiled-coil protein SlyX